MDFNKAIQFTQRIEGITKYIQDHSTFKNPPAPPIVIEDVMNALLHSGHKVENIYFGKSPVLVIEFSWDSRGSYQSEQYEIPVQVFEADSVYVAARKWYLTEQYNELSNDIRQAHDRIKAFENEQLELQKEINLLDGIK